MGKVLAIDTSAASTGTKEVVRMVSWQVVGWGGWLEQRGKGRGDGATR